MERKTAENAYAKINLMLEIAGIREDGYHLIDGVMQTISLADRLELTYRPADATVIDLRMIGGDPSVPADGTNLVCRAAELFLKKIGVSGRVEIVLEKLIPVAAGLAGGSSDAAATLRALNRIFENRLSVNDLCAIGETLGADVPFCIRGGAMRTEGIGEKLTPCRGLPDCHIVVARGQDRVSTPAAYRLLDERFNHFSKAPDPAPRAEKLIQVLRKGDLFGACEHFSNIFEEPVSELCGSVGTIRTILQQACAVRAMMSGSGPAVFGVFQTEAQAENVRQELARRGIAAYLCRPVPEIFFDC